MKSQLNEARALLRNAREELTTATSVYAPLLREQIKKFLSRPAEEVPGMVLVPREPTDAMLIAGIDAFQHTHMGYDNRADWRACYRAMLAASQNAEKERE